MFKPNEIFDNTYRIEQEIGHGGTGVVYRAYHLRLKKYVVIKRIFSNFDGSLDARTEVDILKKLHHPCLPQVYDFLQVGREVYTVMDYIQGCGLDALNAQYGRWPEQTLRRWLHQLLETLVYLHGQKPSIIHSDIKPGNIMLTTAGNMCLIDFNISLNGSGAGKITGFSANYAAPEQAYLAQMKMQHRPCCISLDCRTDLYSLAATFYTLISGAVPTNSQPNMPLQRLVGGRYTPGLLGVLDKAMAWDAKARYRDARQMLAALDRLKRQDRRYRAYVAAQAVSWLGSAVLLAGGIYCVVRGTAARRMETYRSDYNALYQAVLRQDDGEILQYGSHILSQEGYEKILKASPEDYAGILHTMGDSYYNQNNLASALRYYQQALEEATPTDPALGGYYSDYAVAKAQNGDTDGAAALLKTAETIGIDDSQLLLIRCAIEQRKNDPAACRESARQLLSKCSDAALCARACLLAVDACANDTATALPWLETARGYQQSREILRRLGAAYIDMAGQDSGQANTYRSQALECYKTLCGMNYATLEDKLNLATVQRMNGDIEGSIRTLNSLWQQEKDYRISMNLAFAYDAAGDEQNAASWCGQALRSWKQTPEANRESENSDMIQNLQALQKKLGV